MVLVRWYKALRVTGGTTLCVRAVPSAALAHKEECNVMTNVVISRLSNILGANRRLADAERSMLQKKQPGGFDRIPGDDFVRH